MTYEIKLADGSVVEWNGEDGPAAARRYADAHRGITVVAWREPRAQVRAFAPGRDRIIE